MATSLSDLARGRAPADPLVGATRALLGQGLGMGWGDEAEAYLRSKLGTQPYEQALAQIRREYAQYAQENPVAQTVSEFAGAALPGVAMMFVPGMQPAAATSTAGALGRLMASGALTGAVSGAGSALEGERGAGSVTGGVIGGVVGLGAPVALRGASGAARWLRDRLAPTEESIQRRASEKFTRAMGESGVTPQQIEQRLAADRALGVPSVVANADPALTDLAEAVAQRTGRGARRVESTLVEQKLGARERAHQQVVRGLHPGDYYADEQKLVEGLRAKATPAYEAAYAHGAVDDPLINRILQHPTFQDAYQRGRRIAESQALAARLRGEDPKKYLLPEIYKPTGAVDTLTNAPIMELTAVPDVRTLDYVKRGLDDLIDAGYKGSSSVGKGQSSALRDLRNQFVAAIDRKVPAYRDVRRMYAGDMEVIEAMRLGLNDFGKLDHEQVIRAVSKMSQAEKEAFRTGVARDLYGKIMNPSTNFNAAQRIIGSQELQAKLQPLFDSPAHFNLFRGALEREAQLFNQANRVLGGSQTGKRLQMREALEESPGVGEAMATAVTGGFWPSLTGVAARALRSNTMTEPVADKLSRMLMSKDPHDVAAVVRLLQQHADEVTPRAVKARSSESGLSSGTTGALHPAPGAEVAPSEAIDAPLPDLPGADAEGAPVRDIEQDILSEQRLQP